MFRYVIGNIYIRTYAPADTHAASIGHLSTQHADMKQLEIGSEVSCHFIQDLAAFCSDVDLGNVSHISPRPQGRNIGLGYASNKYLQISAAAVAAAGNEEDAKLTKCHTALLCCNWLQASIIQVT